MPLLVQSDPVVSILIPLVLLAIDLIALVVAGRTRVMKYKNDGVWGKRGQIQFQLALIVFFMSSAIAIALFLSES